MTLLVIVAAVVLGSIAYVTLSGFGATYRQYRAERLLTCPENHAPVVVRVNNLRAAHTAAISGDAVVRLDRCTRWPEKADCDQACLASYADAPEASPAEAFLIEFSQMAIERQPIPTPHQTIPPSLAVY